MRLYCRLILLCILIACVTAGCKPKISSATTAPAITPLVFSVEEAPEWTSLFYRHHGWFGGDGIFAVSQRGIESSAELNDDDVLFWFSDSMIGDIKGDSLQPGYKMINNTTAVLAGGIPDTSGLRFYWNKTAGERPVSVFIPNTPMTKDGEYYWLGDGFVNHAKNRDLYIFGYRITNIPDMKVFGFRETGSSLLVVPAGAKAPFAAARQTDLPFFAGRSVDSVGSFGAAILVNTRDAGAADPDGFVYIYGVRGKTKQVYVARVRPDDLEEFKSWRFWTGTDWSSDANRLQPIADRASNEMSVTAIGRHRYVMVFQKDGMGKQVGLRAGSNPWGPFGEIQDVYDVSRDLDPGPNLFPYNAKAHPVLSRPGELVISYNINSFDFDADLKKLPRLYRPRFIRVKYR